MVILRPGSFLISIHAPPRGATCMDMIAFSRATTFQFTPLREGRRRNGEHAVGGKNFNSRPSARGDSIPRRERGVCFISIHAPPRGATWTDCAAVLPKHHFNSRPSARGDSLSTNDIIYVEVFQFTPLREGRQQKICNFCKSFVQPLQISMA